MNAPCKALKGAMVIAVSTVVAISTTACGSTEYDPAKDPKIGELNARGFTDPVRGHNGSHEDTYHATLGDCRVRITITDDTSKVTAHQGDTQVPDANATLLKQLDQFQHCIQEDDTKE